MLAPGRLMGLNPIGRPSSARLHTSPPHLYRRKSISRIAPICTTSYRPVYPNKRRKAQTCTAPTRTREKKKSINPHCPHAHGR